MDLLWILGPRELFLVLRLDFPFLSYSIRLQVAKRGDNEAIQRTFHRSEPTPTFVERNGNGARHNHNVTRC